MHEMQCFHLHSFGHRLASLALLVQVPETVTDAINTEVANVRKLLDSETSAESIKEAVSNLQKALMKIGEHLAQSGQVKMQVTPM